ncbi:MAG: hypothetical protein M3Z08_02370 [Chloroflexota bacterium]|nr:hypothetical protein [Chloroflexota bacterium]
MLYDQLRESWAFKEIWDEAWEDGSQKGQEAGLQKGLQEGLQQGKIAALREMVLALVEKRFPRLQRMAEKIVSMTSEPVILEQMILSIGPAQTAEEALTALLESSEDGKN